MRETAVLVTLACLTSACAFTDVPLTLPTRGLDPTIPGGRGRQVIVVVPFSDARQIRQRCGMQKNGYNMDTADAICQSDPNAWFAQLLADELRASGFSVLDDEAEHRPTALRIEGSLIKIFVEPVIGFWSGSLEADLSVKLRATTQTGLEAERTFFVKGWKGGAQVSSSQVFQTALQRATEAILGEMVNAILELMDRYPQLGLRSTPGPALARARGGVAMKGLALGHHLPAAADPRRLRAPLRRRAQRRPHRRREKHLHEQRHRVDGPARAGRASLRRTLDRLSERSIEEPRRASSGRGREAARRASGG